MKMQLYSGFDTPPKTNIPKMEVDGSDEFPFQTRDFLVLLEVSFRGGYSKCIKMQLYSGFDSVGVFLFCELLGGNIFFGSC